VTRREERIAEIAKEEKALSALRDKVEQRAARLAFLRNELDTLIRSQPTIASPAAEKVKGEALTSNSEKVSLFRSLFHGREDVFPRRWENSRTGKSGYSPACANEWESGVCEKGRKQGSHGSRATCGTCQNQAFLPVTNEEVTKHLKGLQVMGVYPLLPDETCWFLAADFDKKSWREDVSAFVATCQAHDVPVAVERSRSGNGAHAWFFFSAPVPAAIARRMGCFIITQTMPRRHQLSMDSYDRLFPNQNTMPKGGFGNLIALPMQREARECGNSVFVDAEFKPYADQWAFLANIRRLDPSLVHAIADEASHSGLVTGVRACDVMDEDEKTPWRLSPSGRPRRVVITEPLPPEVRAVLCQRIFVEKAGLPSVLLNQIKRLAAFQNPEFYKKQRMRLSTALTPRIIACAEERAAHIALPRGCLSELESLLRSHKVSLAIEDKRECGEEVEFKFHGRLTPLQEDAAQALLTHDTGVFVAPPGIGKTVVGAYMIAARRRSTLVLVHRKPLLDQWVAQLALFLKIEPKDIGQIGGGKHRPNGRIDVAMIQSLVRKGEVNDLVAGYGHVVVDECHHVPAVSFERVLSEMKARYVTGLTATPQRRDGHHPIIQMQIGPVRFAVAPGNRGAKSPFAHRLVVRETDFRTDAQSDGDSIQMLYAALAADQERNDLIFSDVLHVLDDNRSPILLTERREHLDHFAARFQGHVQHLIVLHGGMKPKERREALARISSIPPAEGRLLLATGRYIGEGFDDARLDTLFLALPVSWKGTLVQYTGRLNRLLPGKTDVRIYDYVDREVPMLLKMFHKRLRGYRAIGYVREDAEIGRRTLA